MGDKIKAVILGMDDDFSRISLSTADLEEEAGDMTRDKVHFQGLGLGSSLHKTRCASRPLRLQGLSTHFPQLHSSVRWQGLGHWVLVLRA